MEKRLLICLLICVSSAYAAEYIQGNYNEQSGNSCTVSFNQDVAPGSLLVVVMRIGGDVSATCTSEGQIFTVDERIGPILGDWMLDMHSLPNAAGGPTTITCSLSGSVDLTRMSIMEFSDAAAAIGTSENDGSGSNIDAGDVSITEDALLVVAAASDSDEFKTKEATPGPGYIIVGDFGLTSPDHPDKTEIEYRVAGAGTHSGTMSGVSCDWAAILVAYSAGQCQAQCSGIECGPDGCGGTCAPGCLAGETCSNGICISVPGNYWVSPTGSASWSNCYSATPLSGSSACSLSTANNNAQAGDTIMMRAGTYTGTFIEPTASGTDGNGITFMSYPGDQVVITGDHYGFHIDQQSYIDIKNINFWNLTRNFYIETGTNILVEGNTFKDMYKRSIWCSGRIWKNSHHVTVRDNVFSRWGFESNGDDDFGCLLDIANEYDNEDYCHHILVEDNDFSYGGHHIMGIRGKYNVIRNNNFHNDPWYYCSRPSINNLCGNRNIISGGDYTYCQFNLYEGNTFAFSSVPADQDTSTGFSVRSPNNIIRKNLFYHNDGPGLDMATFSSLPTQIVENNHIYNNVFFHNGYNQLPEIYDHHNNVDRFQAGISLQKHGGPMHTDNSIKNNLFFENQYGPIYYYYVDENLQEYENNYEGDCGVLDSTGADPYNPNSVDFHLTSSSNCIDAGGFLTTITSSSGSGTTFNVEDAGYFMDGWGIVESDRIQLEGDSAQVRIASIDYDANEITLDAPLSWTSGQGIALAYEGLSPDAGAYEHSGACVEVSFQQLIDNIDDWKDGRIGIANLMQKIVRWKNGC